MVNRRNAILGSLTAFAAYALLRETRTIAQALPGRLAQRYTAAV